MQNVKTSGQNATVDFFLAASTFILQFCYVKLVEIGDFHFKSQFAKTLCEIEKQPGPILRKSITQNF